MRDLLTIAVTSIAIILLWIYMGGSDIAYSPPREIPKETLEISTPIDGRIDIEFLKEIN